MSLEQDLKGFMLEVTDRLARIETKVEAHNGFNERVKDLEENVTRLHATQKIYKWVIGLFVAVSVGLMKALK